MCRAYHVAFSVHTVGGYFHKGSCAEERMRKIARERCLYFHLESAVITVGEAEVHFIRRPDFYPIS